MPAGEQPIGGTGAAIIEATTSFIGREHDRTSTKRSLTEHRVTTIVGVGGAGKTRLVLEVTRDVANSYPDGAFFVALANIDRGALVAEAVTLALGVRHDGDAAAALEAFLGTGTALLVLDNCEHVVADAATLVGRLVAVCDDLTVLTTSREALRVPGEAVHPLPPMAAPPAEATPEEVLGYDAARLYVDRASDANPAFVLRAEDAPWIASICRRLDGIPLAIELAAARARVLTPRETDARLGERFAVLRSRDEPAVRHHRTLREAIAWSVDLLSEDERVLFPRLGIFGGSFDLDAVEEICGTEPLDRVDALDLMERLVERSLVVVDQASGVTRFRLLESIGAYARDLLQTSGEEDALARRHLDRFARLTSEVYEAARTDRQNEAYDRLEREHDNVRAALDRCVRSTPDDERLLRILSDIHEFWRARGHVAEGRARLAEALDRWRGPPTADLAACWIGAGVLAQAHADLEGALRRYERSLEVARAIGDPNAIGNALKDIGNIHGYLGQLDAMRDVTEQALALFRTTGHLGGIGATLVNLGNVAFFDERYDDAKALYEEAVPLLRVRDDQRGVARAVGNLAEVAWQRGDTDGARRMHEEALAIHRALGERGFIAEALRNYGAFLCDIGDADTGFALLRQGLADAAALQARETIAQCLMSLAVAEGQRPERSAMLAAVARATWASVHGVPQPLEEQLLAAAEAAARVALGDGAFERETARGRAMPLEGAVAFGLAIPEEDPNIVTFTLEGEAWTIQRGDRAVRLRDVKGLRYLHALVGSPRAEIAALALAAGSADTAADATIGPVLDDEAKAAYRARLRDLSETLSEAEEWNDVRRAEAARVEVQTLERELARAVGLGGRDRLVGSSAERARQTVTKAIKAAVERIGRHDPELAAHLEATVRTGISCSYEPPDPDPFTWRL